MKPGYLALVCACASSPALGVAVPPAQDAVPPPARHDAPAPPHRPLFEVRYVLLEAPAAAPDGRAIDIVDGRGAIRPPSVDPSASTLLRGDAVAPNVLICRGWGCIKQPEATRLSK